MKLFRIYECNDYGKPIYYLGVFIAESKQQAREIASINFNNKEIVSTGFYDAEEVTQAGLDKERKEAMDEIKKKTTIINPST